MNANIQFVPKRFSNMIALHVIKNMLWDHDFRTPLILGIHGPSGEGKTYQASLTLDQMGVAQVSVSGREFESATAGEPALQVEQRYLEASSLVSSKECAMASLVIHDIDACIGSWGPDVQYTVNTQLVIATLLAIADSPLFIRGVETVRIPIIFTGNDFSKLYEPLTRHGRMTSFTWKPTHEEKTQIVHSFFADSSLTLKEAGELVQEFAHLPVAFFSLLKNSMFDSQIIELIESTGLERVIDLVTSRPGTGITSPIFTLTDLVQTGKNILSSELINHLDKHRQGKDG